MDSTIDRFSPEIGPYKSIISEVAEEVHQRRVSIDKNCAGLCVFYPDCGCVVDVVQEKSREAASPSLSKSHNSDVL